MSQRLPELIEPLRMAENRRILKGTIPLSTMKRLASLLIDNAGNRSGKVPASDVNVDLTFDVDATGQANITGRVQAIVVIQCQRCMQPMNWQIDEPVSLAIIRSEKQADQLPSYYEPLIVEEDTLLLSELVEDELILAMPSVPLHDPKLCPVRTAPNEVVIGSHNRDSEVSVHSERKNPFAILEQLRNKKDRETD